MLSLPSNANKKPSFWCARSCSLACLSKTWQGTLNKKKGTGYKFQKEGNFKSLFAGADTIEKLERLNQTLKEISQRLCGAAPEAISLWLTTEQTEEARLARDGGGGGGGGAGAGAGVGVISGWGGGGAAAATAAAAGGGFGSGGGLVNKRPLGAPDNDSGVSSGESRSPSPALKRIKQVRLKTDCTFFGSYNNYHRNSS